MIAFCCANLLLSPTLAVGLQLAAMAASDATQPAADPERRLAENGRPYTREQFLEYYGSAGELEWTKAEDSSNWRGSPAGGNAAQLLAEADTTNQQEDAMGSTEGPPADGDAAQLPAVLLPQHVIAIQNAEAARGPPRSLHRLARDALNLHIRIPHKATVNMTLRKRIVAEALRKLESEVPVDSATQPDVLVLVGDPNITKELAED